MSSLSILYYCGNRGLDLTKGEGYRIHVLKILEHLRAGEHRPFLLTVNDSETLPGFSDYLCVPHRYLRGAHHVLPYTGTFDSLAMYRAAVRLHRIHRFDVIHERFGLYSYGAALAARRLGIPLVLEVNGPTIEEKQLFTDPLTGAQLAVARAVRDYVARRSGRIVVVSSVLKRFLLKHWKGVTAEKIEAIPNAAEVKQLGQPEDVDGLRREMGLENRFVVGFLGTFQPWYGLEKLIDAFALVSREVPEAILLMVGDGTARAGLEEQVRAAGLEQVVRFCGYVPHDQVPRYLGLFDVAVAAFRELGIGFFGSPIKLFEYMAAGRSIVASRIGQIPEIVTHEREALLVTPGDVSELEAAIVRLARDTPLRERLGGAARAEGQKYSWEAYSEQLAQIYRAAIAERM
ncbi:MAG: glycosyltransferase family 4 protein [candidate division Zixibacteria bacterium]|nr:glycosyltransferase family 4 protein [candidate division Zixibacteria bacterium]